MTPTERQRIEKEADEYGQWVMDKTKDFHDGINAKDAYVAGATSEHDKARNQAIDEVISRAASSMEIFKHCDSKIFPTMPIRAETLKDFIQILEELKNNQLT